MHPQLVDSNVQLQMASYMEALMREELSMKTFCCLRELTVSTHKVKATSRKGMYLIFCYMYACHFACFFPLLD